jgi:hypothetical protein
MVNADLLTELIKILGFSLGLMVYVATFNSVPQIPSAPRHRERNRHRNRQHALNEMNNMNERHFKRMFRMSRKAFNLLEERLQENDDMRHRGVRYAQNSSGSNISLRTRLACTLRWLAGGSYIDICFEFGIAPGTFYADGGVLWGTMEHLNEVFNIGFPFHDKEKLKEMSRGFAKYSSNVLKGCVLAIDGWVCRTRQPLATEVRFPIAYRNRHDCFGLVVMAGCDADCRFHMFSCVSSGSTNDILAWDMSAFKSLLDEGRLSEDFFVIGDEAFQNTQQFLTPWSGRGLIVSDPYKDSFNYHLSAMRQCIERAFGILTQRWGIF